MNRRMQDNQQLVKTVKSQLNIMKRDVEMSRNGVQKDEPECRTKQMMHKTCTTQFRDVLRVSQSIQTEFKHAVETKMKK